jgi:hypothetical protein
LIGLGWWQRGGLGEMLKICQVVGKKERIRCERLSGHYQNDNDEKRSLS